MSTQQTSKKETEDKKGLKPGEETLNTSDPQEEMKGPVSSFMQGIKKTAEDNNKETKEEADEKKEKNI
ncbi:MAG: hypothetical protein ABI688_03430 [Bacteroidota bacterium]